MGLHKAEFMLMGYDYFKEVSKPETRLWFGPMGGVLLAGGLLSLGFLTDNHIAMPITLALLFAAGGIMRVQASVGWRFPSLYSMRNAAIMIIVLMLVMLIAARLYVGSIVGLIIAAALLALHKSHMGRWTQWPCWLPRPGQVPSAERG